MSPEPTQVLEESAEPKLGLPTPESAPAPAHHPAKVRRTLAMCFVGLIGGATLVGAVGWFIGKDVTEWALFASPVFTLGGAATAFYFGAAESPD